jgi:dTDP-4-dehydrorhamnose 3,5-epimerase
MPFEETSISGVFVHTSEKHYDNRGHFEEQLKLSELRAEIGTDFHPRQVNQSKSLRGVLRGIHFTEGPPGQAKYISCSQGSVWDVAVDLRVGSSSYGRWFAELLTAENGKSVFISEGLGHAFLALEDSTINYLCSSEYDPSAEKIINPLSPALGIPFEQIMRQSEIPALIMSSKDATASNF